MKCSKCQFENPDNTKFCGNCAAPPIDAYIFSLDNFDKMKGEVYNVGEEKMNLSKKTLELINNQFDKRFLYSFKLNKRLMTLLHSMKICGFTIVMVTNSYRKFVAPILEKFPELVELFDKIYCVDDTGLKKSEGSLDVILKELNADPTKCIIFGDDDEQDGANKKLLYLKTIQDSLRYAKC